MSQGFPCPRYRTFLVSTYCSQGRNKSLRSHRSSALLLVEKNSFSSIPLPRNPFLNSRQTPPFRRPQTRPKPIVRQITHYYKSLMCSFSKLSWLSSPSDPPSSPLSCLGPSLSHTLLLIRSQDKCRTSWSKTSLSSVPPFFVGSLKFLLDGTPK